MSTLPLWVWVALVASVAVFAGLIAAVLAAARASRRKTSDASGGGGFEWSFTRSAIGDDGGSDGGGD